MIPVAEFSKLENLTEEKTIALIKEGVYSGRIVDGEWFVEDVGETDLLADEYQSTKQILGPFLKGCLVGLLISILFGLMTYPWEDPTFEGASGYHAVMMILVTPFITIGSGIAYWLFKKLNSNRRENHADESNRI